MTITWWEIGRPKHHVRVNSIECYQEHDRQQHSGNHFENQLSRIVLK